MGFKFEKTFVPVEIEGKEYQIRVGDLDAIEEADRLVERINEIAENESLPINNRMIAVFKEIRNLVACMLGKEACEEIFANRGNNFLETVQLATYLKKASAEAHSEGAMADILKEFGLR